jgi:hypothetical protein
MNRLESRIRDYLAEHLTLLELGLVLVQKEFRLANPFGAGGSIDILAKDKLGHFVVIEIKRSDQSARSALHELTKYVALLRSTLGIRTEQIRALLLSTDWNELAVPFSEYQKVCEVPTDGLVLTTQPDGIVVKVESFIPPEIERPLSISRQQHVFLFADAERRNKSIHGIVEAAGRAVLKDFAIFTVDYEGQNKQVIYPHGAYFVFSSPLEGLSPDAIAVVKTSIPWEEELDDQDENFLVAFMDLIEINQDDSEIGYPEKLASTASRGWRITVAYRAGRYAANRLLLSDDQLIAEAKKTEGGANYYLERTVSPRYVPSWIKFKQDAELILMGNKAWTRFFFDVVEDIENKQKQATVSVYLYNPMNIVLSLVKLCSKGGYRYMPGFQLLTTYEDEAVLFMGTLAWNGQHVTLPGQVWIEKAYGSVNEYMLMQHFGEQFQKDDRACKLLGLSSVVFEVKRPGTITEEKAVLSLNRGKLIRTSASEFKQRSIAEFCSENKTFCISLVQDIAAFSTGMVE